MYLWGALASFLFSSPFLQNTVPVATTLSATSSTSTRQIINEVNEIYKDLSKGCYSVQVTPTIQFKHVSPFSVRTESQSKIVEFQSSEDISSNDVYQFIGDFHEKTKPILLYLPGLDGVGISIASQINDLSEPFELWRMSIDQNDDRSTFTQLTTAVSSFIQDVAMNHDREVILVGESFGGLLAPAVALRMQSISKKRNVKNPIIGLVMANPATSFDETQWSTLAPILASLRHVEQEEENSSLPTPYSVIGSLTLSAIVPDRTQFQRILDMVTSTSVTSLDEAREILDSIFDGFGMVAQNLPAEVIEHRVGQWLPVGCSVVNPRLGSIDIPTLVIASEEDNMLPTKKEGQRLLNNIPNCTTFFVKGSGHFIFDDRFNLTDAIIEAPFDPLKKRKGSPAKEYDPIIDWKLPTDEELQETLNTRVRPLRMLTSPKFFSTTLDGKRVSGLGMIPNTESTGKPLLIVANHQLLGLDLGLIIAELLEERGISARGLAHPIVFQGNGADNGFGPAPTRKVRKVNKDGELEKPLGQFQSFGAVMVTPRNFYRLMETGQTALLFPGGVREVFHGKEEAYKLFWPEKVDFVRVAARFNATILPLSAIGAADSANILLDAPEILNLPFGLGERAQNNTKNTIAARYDSQNDEEVFQPPIVAPKLLPARHYFVFGKPFDTTHINHKDKVACGTLYKEVKKELVRGLEDLLKARENDPYADTLKRLAYERILRKQSPTFPLSELNEVD